MWGNRRQNKLTGSHLTALIWQIWFFNWIPANLSRQGVGLLGLYFISTPSLKPLNSHCSFFCIEKESGTFTVLPIIGQAETSRTSAVVGPRGVLTRVLTQASRVIPALIYVCQHNKQIHNELRIKSIKPDEGRCLKSVKDRFSEHKMLQPQVLWSNWCIVTVIYTRLYPQKDKFLRQHEETRRKAVCRWL